MNQAADIQPATARPGWGRLAVIVATLAVSAPAASDSLTTQDALDKSVRAPIEFTVDGDTLRGSIDIAAGAGPHPTVILFNGFQGWPETPGFAQRVTAPGYNMVFVPYRGTWSQEGEMSADNVIADAAATLAFIRLPEVAEKYRIDTDNIALWGISFGAWAALSVAADEPSVECVAAQVVANLGTWGNVWKASDPVRTAWAGRLQQVESSGAIQFKDGAGQLMSSIMDNADRFDLVRLAPSFQGRKVLMFGAEDDEVNAFKLHYQPVAAAMEAAKTGDLTLHTAPGKHVDPRPEWMAELAHWLENDCFD